MNEHTRNHSTDAAFEAEAERVENAIGRILLVGAIAALTLIVAGAITSFVRHPHYATSPSALPRLANPGENTMQTILEVEAGILNFRGRAVVMAGLLLLILMPVLRVAVTIVVFAHQRDWTYMVLTTIVLALLIISFLLGKTG
jgi:uncharacterized membrane protein